IITSIVIITIIFTSSSPWSRCGGGAVRGGAARRWGPPGRPPAPLRLAEVAPPSDVTDSSAEPLPEFLADDGGQVSDVGEIEVTQAVAAE
ncbi:MAG TPA: hypothetical protein DHH36_21870, partial [Afipia sp.]|nr:hypothetical protein [Afipia sp.]